MTRSSKPSKTVSCVGKDKFTNETKAKDAMMSRVRRGATHLTMYKCRFCGGWHIGHTRGWKRRVK